jgi:HEAT repeat protein
MSETVPLDEMALFSRALRSPSFWQRRAATRVLANRPSVPDVLPALVGALGDADAAVRRRAVLLLTTLPIPQGEVLPLLSSMRLDPEWPVRRAAILALQKLGESACPEAPALIAFLADPVAGVREATAEVVRDLAIFLATPERSQVAVLLRQMLKDPDERLREAALQTLARIEDDPVSLVEVFCSVLSDEATTVRHLAVRALGESGPAATRAVPVLQCRLQDMDHSIRIATVEALGQIGDAGVIEDIVPFLGEVGELREAAVKALALLALRIPSVEPRLLVLHQQGPASLRSGAGCALARAGSPVGLDALRQTLRGKNPSARRRAVRALGWFAGDVKEVLPGLETALRDSHGRMRKAAAEALGHLGPGAVGALPGLLRRLYDQEPRVRAACGAALTAIASGLPDYLRVWLFRLTRPSGNPGRNLREVLNSADLPEVIRGPFLATCLRRAAWHAGHAGEEVPVSDGITSAWEAARSAARLAGRKRTGASEQRAARTAEYAWLLAHLWAQLASASPG